MGARVSQCQAGDAPRRGGHVSKVTGQRTDHGVSSGDKHGRKWASPAFGCCVPSSDKGLPVVILSDTQPEHLGPVLQKVSRSSVQEGRSWSRASDT